GVREAHRAARLPHRDRCGGGGAAGQRADPALHARGRPPPHRRAGRAHLPRLSLAHRLARRGGAAAGARSGRLRGRTGPEGRGSASGPPSQSSIEHRTAPAETVAPISALMPLTMPERCAVIGCSIFIASRTISRSPSATDWPSSATTLTIVPCIGAETLLPPPAASPAARCWRLRRCRTGAWGARSEAGRL